MRPVEDDPGGDGAPRPDLRMVLLAAVAWAACLAALLLPLAWTAGLAGTGAAALVARGLRGRGHRRAQAGGGPGAAGRSVVLLGGCLLVGLVAAVSATLRAEAVRSGPVAELAGQRAFVTATVRVTGDPVLRQGRYAPFVLVRARVERVVGRGEVHRTGVPVLVVADVSWQQVRLGSTVEASGRLAPADGPDLAGVLSSSRPARVLDEPGELRGAAEHVRAGIRAAVAPLGTAERALIPALVVGDDQGLPPEVVESFRVAGLTHLAAVSGTNLTLVVGFLLVVARWVGVRARGLMVVGALGVAAFVLLARAEPSVVRAAAMGSVALLGMGSNGREKGVRALGVAVLVLLLFDPWLALSLGFALSALATAGILFLAPPWRDALRRWLPRWAAEAVAVPLAAQLVCTPLVAAISGQVSLVAVAANMLVAAAVGPATVLGLLGGLVVLVVPPVGLLLGRLAGLCAWWIVHVAERSAALPTAALDWSTGRLPVLWLTLLCVGLASVMPSLLARRRRALPAAALLVVSVLRPLPSPGWPPQGWVMVMCDVGQGDGLVLNAGAGAAVVVDAGPDPVVMDRCLTRLGVRRVPTVVLTHFHADHVDGLPGVLDGREVGEVEDTSVRVPYDGAAAVDHWAATSGVPVRVPAYGEVRRAGQLTWQVIGPSRAMVEADHGEEGTVANNASVVLLVQVRGLRMLLAGDMEPEAQATLAEAVPQLRVDVLKVPHHGSRYQDPPFLTGLGARLALVSVGADNDYGHPAPETLALLRGAGMQVHRTDTEGDLAVVVRDGQLRIVSTG